MKTYNKILGGLAVFTIAVFSIWAYGYTQHGMGGTAIQHGQMMQGQDMMNMTEMMKTMNGVNQRMDAMLEQMHGDNNGQSMQHMQPNDALMMMTHNMDDMAKYMGKFMQNMQDIMQDQKMMNNTEMQKQMSKIQEHMEVMTKHMNGMSNNIEAVNNAAKKSQ